MYRSCPPSKSRINSQDPHIKETDGMILPLLKITELLFMMWCLTGLSAAIDDPFIHIGGGPTAFGGPGNYGEVVKTDIDCRKTFMTVNFKFTRPFNGYIYPFGFFAKCVLWVGRGETEVTLKLSQDICGAPPPDQIPGYLYRTDPLIEHRLMIQWDTDLVQEYDTNVLLRCDRPDDYNRTVKFDLTSIKNENIQALIKTYPGPKIWMEIQDGEGPSAPPLIGPVYLGQTLSLVFTLGDEIFNFDSNVLHCWATDGQTNRQLIPIIDPNQGNVPQRPLLTQLQVIENACSTKPKLFANVQKARDTYNGIKTTTQWVYFKAFRFPTSSRVLIQCDLQVCFEKCYPLKPCGLPYDVRSRGSRKRRSANDIKRGRDGDKRNVQPEMLTMYRALEVFLPTDQDLGPMAVINGTTDLMSKLMNQAKTDCFSRSTFYGVLLGLGFLLLLIITVNLVIYFDRRDKKNRTET